jgi:hypothetical protein
MLKLHTLKQTRLLLLSAFALVVIGLSSATVLAVPPRDAGNSGSGSVGGGSSATFKTGNNDAKGDTCGGTVDNKDLSVHTTIKIGCKGVGNPIADATFAIIRFLSNGVGLVIIGSFVFGGIQYSASRGDPQATAMAVNRLRSTVLALVIYIFSYAILNYLLPAGFLG